MAQIALIRPERRRSHRRGPVQLASYLHDWAVPAIVGMLLLFLWILIISVSVVQKQRLLDANQESLLQLNKDMAVRAASIFQDVETGLRVMDRMLQANPRVDPRNDPQFAALVDDLRRTSKGVIDPRLVSGDGRVYRIPDGESLGDAANRSNLRILAPGAERRPVIGEPYRNRASGKWEVSVSWSLDHPVAGIVLLYVNVDLSPLDVLHEELRPGARTVAVLRNDGVVLSGSMPNQALPGSNLAAEADFRDEYGAKTDGTFVRADGDDSQDERLVSYMRLDDYPVTVVVSRSLDLALSEFTTRRILLFAIAGALTLLSLGLTRAVIGSQRALKRAQADLQELESTDSLTGVMSRRAFFELALREIRRSTRYQRPSAILMLDLDHFKSINDTYGHAAGDVVLAGCARGWKAGLREQDLLGRIGGEEFCVVLPETPPEAARQVAERLRGVVAQLRFDLGATVLTTTVSIGLTMIESGDQDPSQPIGRADRALYEAKQQGRDRVVIGQGPAIQAA